MSEAARTPGSGVARPLSAELRVLLAPLPRLRRRAGQLLALLRREHRRGPSRPSAAAEPDSSSTSSPVLAGAVGSAPARFIVGSVVEEEPLAVDEVLQHPRRDLRRCSPTAAALERKSQQLQAATTELRHANERARGARPAQRRFRVHHHPRVAHAADIDPRVLRDPVRQSPTLTLPNARVTCGSLCRRPSGLTPADQPGARPFPSSSPVAREWHIEPMSTSREVVATSAQATARIFHEREVGLEVRHARPDAPHRAGRPRPARCRCCSNLLSNAVKVLPARDRHGCRSALRHGAPRFEYRRTRQRIRHSRRGPRGHLREVPSGRRHPHQPSRRHRARSADQPPDRGAPRRAAVGGEPLRGEAPRSRSHSRSRSSSPPRPPAQKPQKGTPDAEEGAHRRR